MPGMNPGVSPASPILMSAFRSALLHQWLIIALVVALLLIAWGVSRTAVYGSVAAAVKTAGAATARGREPRARSLLRVGFGLAWLFDGFLQAQPRMPGGLADQVIQPTASSSPGWVQHLVNFGVNLWDYHPIQAATSAVWIQVGIGLWLIFAVRGRSSRLAGLTAVAWGLVVWAFGEAFGGIFAPGLTVLFGAPGAALIYVVAGIAVALPERAWDSARPGRLLLAGTGVFFLGMALLQAWPGRGFWQGGSGGQLGSLTRMIASMASTSQPPALHAVVSGFGNFAIAHGYAVNLVAVVALALIGAGLLAGALRADRRLVLAAVIAGTVFCLADWMLVEDLGFLGGLGTDPNSMIPLILLFTAGYLGLSPAVAAAAATTATAGAASAGAAPALVGATIAGEAGTATVTSAAVETGPPSGAGHTEGGATEVAGPGETGPGAGQGAAPPEPPAGGGVPPAGGEEPSDPPPARRVPAPLRAFAGAPMRFVVGLGALAVVIVGAAPMAFAATNPNADTITAQAIAGTSGQFDIPAAPFTLTSQDGRQVSLSSLRGKVVLLTFLDPVCTSDCPLIAQEMRAADAMLGAKASDTELVAVVANPTYYSTAYTSAFTRQENLSQVPNWLYLTGALGQLKSVWRNYGIEVESLPAGAMVAHNDIAFVISADGTLRQEISDDPGPGTAATKSSFASLLSGAVRQTMSHS